MNHQSATHTPATCRKSAGVLAGLLLALPACTTVYAPMQATMPLLRQAGQTEFSATVQGSGRVEATAAFSPAQGVMFTGAGSTSAKLDQQNFLVTHQYEVAGGPYLPLGSNWLLSALAGFGEASSSRGIIERHWRGPDTFVEYRSRYHTYFGQVGVAQTDPKDSYGFTYRLTQVQFASFEAVGAGPLPLRNMLRHEGLFFYRVQLGPSPVPHWHFLATMGLSVSGTPQFTDDQNPLIDRANRNLAPVFLGSVGVVYALPAKRRN